MLLQLHVISFHVSIFYKTQKKLSRPDFGLFWVQKPKNRIFSKDVLHHFFKLDDTLTSRKKKQNYYERFQRKIPEKRKNVRRVFHWTFTLWVQDSVFFSTVLIGKGITDLQSELRKLL